MPGGRCMQRQNGCRPLTSAIFVAMGLLLLYGPHLARADLSICKELDAILETTAAVTCYSGNAMVYSGLPQDQAVDVLYTLTPKDGVTLVSMVPEKPTDPPFDTYFNLALSDGSAAISVDIIASLEDVGDYSPDGDNTERTTQLTSSKYTLTYKQDSEDKQLDFQFYQFTIADINNKLPEFEAESYSTTLREDWPVDQEIIDLKVMVRDLDFDAHKTPLTVSFDDSCPLNTITGSKEVDVTDGDYSEITFKLESKLNYDENPEVICTLTATDGVHEGSTNIVITVEAGDMPPKFEEVFYKIDVGDESPGVPLTVLPKKIHAEDQGAAPTAVSYSMDDAEPSISGTEYFKIDTTSADVTLIKVLDDEFIKENNQLRFVIYAVNTYGFQSDCFLEIRLPVPLTTPLTTTTCSPCTTPLFTTHELTTASCPPCPECTTPIITTPEPCIYTSQSTTSCEPCVCTTAPTTTCEPCPHWTTQFHTTPEPCICTTEPTTTCEPCVCTTLPSPTCSPCPEYTTPEPTTSEPCEYTTLPSSTCEPCTTCEPCHTPSQVTCEPCVCSTPSSPTTTCEPCPTVASTLSTWLSTTTTTNNPCPPCNLTTTTLNPGTGPTTTHEPSGPVFLKDAYLFQTLQRMNYIGTVKATVDGMTSTDIEYSFSEENNEFRIDSSTGEISKKADIQVQDYSLTVTAEINGISHDALVNIVVHLEDTDASLCITNSLNQVTVQEEVSGATIGDVNYGEKDLKICVIYQEGEDDYNDVLFIFDGNTLKLNASAKLDREIVKQLRVWIQIFDSADVDCSNQYLDSGPRELKRSQSLFVIDVIDQNDHAPVFTYPDEDITLAYPEDPALQKVVGPVIHLRAIDKDDSDSVRYNILEDNTSFAVDAESGVVFWEGDDMGSSCGENGCSFNVKAEDQNKNTSDPIKITVVSLPQEKIYTMSFPDMILSQVEERLTELSDEIEMTVKDLYVTPKPPILTARGGASKYTTRRNYIRSDLGGTPFNLDVHVSALKDGKAVSLERFNNALSAAEEDKAELFKDKEVFNSVEEPSGDVLGYQIALGVTGGLVAVILFALVIMGLIRHRKRSEKRRGPEVPDLRRSYGNQAYANDDIKHHDTLDGASLKMNGSVNGYHEPPRDDRRDSPPLNKSALAATSDTNPLYAAGGLRRTAPEEVPYLGQPASREPPSQFKEPKVSNEYVTSVSKAAEAATPKTPAKVKPTAEPAPTSAATSPYTNVSSFNQPRQKKEPPPLTAAPKKSALKGAGGTTSTASQKTKEPQIPLSSTAPVEPSADYDKSPAKTTTTSFSTLKKSPPPKKKEVVQAKQEEKEKEEEEDMAPERKKSNLKAVTDTESSDADNKRDQKERKSSVAFKVLVEEKTIEAQNEGPAAKKQAESEAKAEANQAAVDIMEANKKKLEDDEEDSDNIKL